ncbi:hypothetical protein [Dietzia alimentaria]|uniref:hypothetical protein n=1 Tax=Dietzia alimentaria TaxID=665550 RepID=UPI00029B380F|nr:hypothetical protein [Dietzia alimentaria]
MSDPWAIIGTGGGVFSVITALVVAVVGWRKNGAETTQIIEATAGEQIKLLAEQNSQLWAKIGKFDADLESLRKDLRSRDRKIDELSDDLDDALGHIRILRDELQRQDPTLRLPEPPARIAEHFRS